ncbi:Crp/Fnr family transcriptional regulator [Maribacter sp. 2210JD10-5]|uniref:Crp/Fnr family transcriptional regulator n=1 Tax=Maribacter sp. 2210JD10-5 TaxID=3386272 RepID=UPI0039BCA243
MEHILVEIMSRLTPLTSQEKLAIEDSFPIKNFDKGTYLLKKGEIATEAYFVIKGCIRAYEIMDGEEKTIAFFTENQSAANFNSLANEEPSILNFVCSEDTTVAICNVEKEAALYQKYPRFETFCRTGMEKMMGNQQAQLTSYMTMKPEQRYLDLLAKRPNLIQRVPQHQLASFLGIKPQSLSRIRGRIIRKERDR